MPKPAIIRSISSLRRTTGRWRKAGATRSRWCRPWARCMTATWRWCGRPRTPTASSVSIFVNPTQFAPHEDFASYPRTWKTDVAALARRRSIWSGRRARPTMYPDGFATRIEPAGPAKAGLEDAFRPHFFGGVATVVAKLFHAGRARTSRCSARRTISSSRSSPRWRAISICRSRSSACRPCARRTASRCRRATPTSRRTSERSRRRFIGC